MNLGQEITNHLTWIDSIASTLGKTELSSEELAAISQHDRCALGQWLDSKESVDLQKMKEFQELVDSHDAFHGLAGDLIDALQAGREEQALALQEQFIAMSQRVITLLRLLQEFTESRAN